MLFLPLRDYKNSDVYYDWEPWLATGGGFTSTSEQKEPTMTYYIFPLSVSDAFREFEKHKPKDVEVNVTLKYSYDNGDESLPKFTKFLPIDDYVLIEDVVALARAEFEKAAEGNFEAWERASDEWEGIMDAAWGADAVTYADTDSVVVGISEADVDEVHRKIREQFMKQTETYAKLIKAGSPDKGFLEEVEEEEDEPEEPEDEQIKPDPKVEDFEMVLGKKLLFVLVVWLALTIILGWMSTWN